MKPNFKDIIIKAATAHENTAEWTAKNKIEKNWKTPEQIPVKPVYTKEDLEGMEQEEAAKKMNISQPTFSRLVEEARKKIADAIVNGKAIKIEGGNYRFVKRFDNRR